MPVGALNVAVAALAAVTVALSMQIVGVLLIAALMVLPVSAAMNVAWSMWSALMLSIAAGLISVLAGLTLAYYADLPPGGTIVLVAAGFVLAATFAGRVRGVLAIPRALSAIFCRRSRSRRFVRSKQPGSDCLLALHHLLSSSTRIARDANDQLPADVQTVTSLCLRVREGYGRAVTRVPQWAEDDVSIERLCSGNAVAWGRRSPVVPVVGLPS